MTAIASRHPNARAVLLALCALGALTACGRPPAAPPGPSGLQAGETPQMRSLVDQYAAYHQIPPALLHRVIQRESGYDPSARNGPYFGLMQILPETARTMGFQGEPTDLLDAETNLRWAGAYLRGAWIVSDGDVDDAVGWYSRGYYYEARDRGLLVETGLRDSELR